MSPPANRGASGSASGGDARRASVRPSRREQVGTLRGSVDHGHGIGGEVRPAGIPSRPGALEQREAGQVSQPLGRIHRGDAVQLGGANRDTPGEVARRSEVTAGS